MSLASRAVAPGKNYGKAAAVAKPAVTDAARSAIGLLSNNKMESLPFVAFGGAVAVSQAFRAVAGQEAQYAAGAILGVVGLVCFYLVATTFQKADKGALLATAGVGSVSLWLAGAVAAPMSMAIFLVGFAIACVMGVPYWIHLSKYRIPAPVTQLILPDKAPEEIVDEFADVKGLQGSKWEGREKATPSGTVRPLRIPRGADSRDIIATKPGAIAGILDAEYDDVELVETERASVVNVFHHTRNLLAEPLPWPLLNNTTWNITDTIPIGHKKTGENAEIVLKGKHLLIGGESGSGKSTLVRALAIIATMDPNCDVYLIDGKRVELSPWRHCAKQYVQDEIGDATNLLRNVQEEMTRRYDLMAANSWFDYSESNGRIGPMVLFIDELPRFLRESGSGKKTDAAKDDFVNRLMDLLDRGRACGLTVIATAIQPSAAQFKNGDLRAGFTLRIAFRMAPGASQMILGPGAGVDASKLPQKLRGMAYLASNEDGVPRAFRAFWLDSPTVLRFAERAEPEPFALDTVLPLDEHYDAPEGDDISSTAVFPDGEAIPSGWRSQLWEMLTDNPIGTAALVDAMPVGRKPVTDTLKAWEAREYITSAPEGKSLTWRKN